MVDDLNRRFNPIGPISDELLSAYLDDEVTPEERALVERSIASSSEVAWRLDSLRQTVALVGQLPRVPLPRSFTLSEADLRPVGRQTRPWWHALLNPVFLRNATAMATVLFLVVLVGNVLLSSRAPAMAVPAYVSATVVVQAPADTQLQKMTVAVEALPAQPAASSASAPATDAATVGAPSAEATPAEAPALSAGASATTAAPDREAAIPAPEATPSPAAVAVAAAVPATSTLAVTAPAVEISGATVVVPQSSAPAAGPTAAGGRSWLDVMAVVLGGLALGLFVAWQLRVRADRGT